MPKLTATPSARAKPAPPNASQDVDLATPCVAGGPVRRSTPVGAPPPRQLQLQQPQHVQHQEPCVVLQQVVQLQLNVALGCHAFRVGLALL